MPTHTDDARPATPAPRRLLRAYLVTTALYFLFMMALWLLGVESIYGHPTPFYALYLPVFDTLAIPVLVLGLAGFMYWLHQRWLFPEETPRVRITQAAVVVLSALLAVSVWQDTQAAAVGQVLLKDLRGVLPHLPPFVVFGGGLAALHWFFRDRDWFEGALTPKERQRFLWGVFFFLVFFSCAVATVRGGLEGISQAYARESYEYVGDIGKASSIRALFTRYVEIHDFLSMHAKVHPPGPVALLWVLSYLVGRGALALSLATILVGSLAVFPLHAWARQLFGEAQARTAVLLYALVPSVVLFTATSADILFAPFTLTTLWLFDRALLRNSWRDALLAGLLYGLLGVLKFSLIGLGAYFAFAGLWLCFRGRLLVVAKVAALMTAGLALFHTALYLWSGFDMIGTFLISKQQFDLDQHHLDLVTPRLPAWTYRFWNPMTWFFFAGIPVSLLFLWRLRGATGEVRARVWIFLLTVLALNLLYLARGEGERSALYLFPFLVLPAAHLLNEMGQRQESLKPILTTFGFMAFQCWLVEAYFYTYW